MMNLDEMLIAATCLGHVEIVKLLLEAHGTVNESLRRAIWNAHTEIVELVEEHIRRSS